MRRMYLPTKTSHKTYASLVNYKKGRNDHLKETQKAHSQYLCFCMKSLLVIGYSLCYIFKGKHLECSRTFKAY